MASVHGPVQPAHPSPFRTIHNASHPRIPYPHPVSTLRFPSAPPPTSSTETSVSGLCLAAARSILRTRADFTPLRQIHHSPFRLPRATPDLVGFDREAPIFHRLRPSSHEVASISDVCVAGSSPTIKGSFSNRAGLVGPSIVCLGFHASEQGDLRRHLLEQVMVDRRPGYVPVEGDQPDGEGDVSVFGVGAERGPGDTQGIRGNGTQRLRGHWPIPDLHPPVDKEVDAAALCDPLPPHLRRQSLALKRTTLYVSTQGPLRPLPPFLFVATRDPVVVLFDIACVFCVTPHPRWYRGPLGQDRFGVVIARLSKAARARPTASKQKQDVRIRIAMCVVVHVHSFAFRIHSLLDERSTYRIQRRHRSGQHTRFMDAMYTPSSLSYLGWSQASIGIRCSLLHMLVSPSASTFFFFFASFAYRTCITVIIIIVVFHTSIACHWAPICTTCKESKKCSNNDNNCA